MDTIFALATPPGRSGVAVVRISGPAASSALDLLGAGNVRPRYAALRKLSFGGRLLDQALVLFFPSPHSFTGEHVAELHLHGGRAVVSGVLQALGGMEGLRPARAGEFARQAWRNGKLDLVQAEALQDLIDSETKSQRDQALLGLEEDGFRRRIADWRDVLVEALALTEAGIDFSEEEDIASDALDQAVEKLRRLSTEWRDLLATADAARLVRDGAMVVIAGPPNAGKSSLLNFLARQEIAIVSERAGTTRDAIEVDLDIAGFAVRFVDTAGIRDTDDEIEAEGVRRARSRLAKADLVLWLDEFGAAPQSGGFAGEVWRIRTKADLGAGDGGLDVTTRRASGCDELLQALETWLRSRRGEERSAVVTRDRHRVLLTKAVGVVSAAIDSAPVQPEVLAFAIRDVADLLSELVGEVGNEDALDLLFSSFCIGK